MTIRIIGQSLKGGVSLVLDARRVQTILYKMVKNAIDYSQGHSMVTVTLERQDIEGNPDQEQLTIRVVDQGIGMSSEVLTNMQKLKSGSFNMGWCQMIAQAIDGEL